MTGSIATGVIGQHPTRHSVLEDGFAVVVGCFVVSCGLTFIGAGGAITGGTAGLSLLLTHVTPIGFEYIFLLVNLPFFVLAAIYRGWNFTVRTGLALILVPAFAWACSTFLHIESMNGFFSVLLGNVLCGMGLLALFRHSSSLGGFNIVGLILQDRTRFRAGFVLMVLDVLVLGVSFLVIDPWHALASVAGVVVLDVLIALNHRPGRYLGI